MCFNPVKALPYAIGGLAGGSLLKSAFGGKKAKASTAEPAGTTTAGTIGPSPSYGS